MVLHKCETCNNYDKFFASCKLTWYETSLYGKKETIHPAIEYKDEWLIKQVGCASHSSISNCNEKKILDTVKKHLDDIIAGELPCGEDDLSLSTVCATRALIESLEKHQTSVGVGGVKTHVRGVR